MSKQKQQGNSCGIAQTKRYALCSPAGQLRKRSAAGRATLWGFSILALVFGFALAGCDNSSGGDSGGGGDTISLSGTTWVQTGNGYTLSLAFTATGWTRTMTWTGQSPETPETGTYSISGSTITFSGGTLNGATATVAGTTLTLTANGQTGTFTKQSGSGGDSGGSGDSGGGGDSGGSGSKPAELSSGATYQQAIDKLDAIIEYCNNNPRGTNDGYKSSAESYRTMISGTTYQTNWSVYSSTVISQINSLISNLQ